MESHTSNATGGVDAVSRLLVAYRLPIYLGGLAVIGAPLAVAAAFDVTVPASARTAIVVATLGVMVATYLAERRVGVGASRGSGAPGAAGEGANANANADEEYPLAVRAAVALSVLGLAAGVYVGLERSLAAGLVFVVGAYLFAYLGYRVLGGTGPRTGGGADR